MPTGDSRNNGFFYLLFELIKGLFNLFLNIFEHFKDLFIRIIDIFFNGFDGKYYTYNIFITLLIIFSLLFYLIYYVNPFKIFNPQIAQLSIIIIASLFLIIFYFVVYRNDPNTNPNYYYNDKKKLIKTETQTIENKYNRKYKFNNENYEFSLKNPLITLFKSFFSLLGIVLIPVIIISLIFLSYHNNNNLYNFTKILLGLLILITSLSIIAYITNTHLSDDTKCKENFFYKILCIIRYLILFIPCLLIIKLEKLKEELKITPKTIYLLFILELILICLFFFIPVLFKYLANLNKHNLLENNQVYYTHKYKHIAYYQFLRGENTKSVKDNSSVFTIFDKDSDPEYNLETKFNGAEYPNKNINNYTYSISFYLYLNPQEKNTNEAYNDQYGVVLFNYGNKPVIKYNGLTKQLIIESMEKSINDSNQRITIFKSNDNNFNNYNLKYQKWLYFVINFKDNNLDIFIDGKLVGSKKNIPNFVANDKVEIGDINYKNKNGIYGSIKEINYYKTPRSNNNIEFLYDLTKNQ